MTKNWDLTVTDCTDEMWEASTEVRPSRADLRASQNHLREARKRANGPVELVHWRQIAERDQWTCQACRFPVNLSVHYNHPAAPTVDHIVPIVSGGSDTRENTRLAHRFCNGDDAFEGRLLDDVRARFWWAVFRAERQAR